MLLTACRVAALARRHIFPESFLYGLVDMQVFGSQLPSFLLGHVYQALPAGFSLLPSPIKSTLPVLLLPGALPFCFPSIGSHSMPLPDCVVVPQTRPTFILSP